MFTSQTEEGTLKHFIEERVAIATERIRTEDIMSGRTKDHVLFWWLKEMEKEEEKKSIRIRVFKSPDHIHCKISSHFSFHISSSCSLRNFFNVFEPISIGSYVLTFHLSQHGSRSDFTSNAIGMHPKPCPRIFNWRTWTPTALEPFSKKRPLSSTLTVPHRTVT